MRKALFIQFLMILSFSANTILNEQIILAQDLNNGKFSSYRYKGQNHTDKPNIIKDDYQVNENILNENFAIHDPDIGINEDGYAIIWMNSINGHSTIFGTQYLNNEKLKIRKFNISTDSTSEILSPNIAMMRNGNFVIAWVEKSDSSSKIMLQSFDKFATSSSERILVNDHKAKEARYPSIAINESGIIVVTWTDWHNSSPKAYVRIFSADLTPRSSILHVSENFKKTNQSHSSVTFYDDSKFVVVWQDYGLKGLDEYIYGQKYNINGSKLGKNLRISWYKHSFRPIVSSDGGGRIVVVWNCYFFKPSKLYCQVISSNDKFITGNILVNTEDQEPEYKSISMDIHGNFVVSWCSNRNSHDIYAQEFFNYGLNPSNSYHVSNTDKGIQTNPKVKFYDNKLYSAWIDSRNDNQQKNIWANILDGSTLATSTTVKEPALYNSIQLDQNYPNPFNPSTTIKYTIPKQSKVTIKVFDLLSNEVATLLNEEQSQGSYEVDFNAKALASGIYFYRLQVHPAKGGIYPAKGGVYSANGGAGDPSTISGQVFVKTKKMILLK